MLDYLHMCFARFLERILAVHDGLHQLWAFFREGIKQLKCIMALLGLRSIHETKKYGLVKKHHSVHRGSLHHHVAGIHFDSPAVSNDQNLAIFVYDFLRFAAKQRTY